MHMNADTTLDVFVYIGNVKDPSLMIDIVNPFTHLYPWLFNSLLSKPWPFYDLPSGKLT